MSGLQSRISVLGEAASQWRCWQETAAQLDSVIAGLEQEVLTLHSAPPTNTDQARQQLQQTDSFLAKLTECKSQLNGVQVRCEGVKEISYPICMLHKIIQMLITYSDTFDIKTNN